MKTQIILRKAELCPEHRTLFVLLQKAIDLFANEEEMVTFFGKHTVHFIIRRKILFYFIPMFEQVVGSVAHKWSNNKLFAEIQPITILSQFNDPIMAHKALAELMKTELAQVKCAQLKAYEKNWMKPFLTCGFKIEGSLKDREGEYYYSVILT